MQYRPIQFKGCQTAELFPYLTFKCKLYSITSFGEKGPDRFDCRHMSRLMTKSANDCAPSEDSDQPGHPPSLIRVFAVRMKKAIVLSYPFSAQRRSWSDWADTQADLSLRWAHSHFVCFVMRLLMLWLHGFLLFLLVLEEVCKLWLWHSRKSFSLFSSRRLMAITMARKEILAQIF